MRDYQGRNDGIPPGRAVYPPYRVDYQGGHGLTSYVNGQVFGYHVGACRLIFTEDREIHSLNAKRLQVVNVAARQPSIAIPEGGTPPSVLRMLRQGCYVRLAAPSGFPAVLMRDGADPDWHGNTQADPRAYNREIAITKSSIWCPPIQDPMILPPIERYVNGYGTADALYPIGGWVTDNLTDYLRWECWLECSLTPFESDVGARQWSGCFTKQFTTAGADLTLLTPLFTLIESEPIGAANVGLVGPMALRAPANCTNAYIRLRTFAYDRDTPLGVAGTAAINDLGGATNLTKEMMTAYCFRFDFFLDYDDPNEADIPALAHFQVTM